MAVAAIFFPILTFLVEVTRAHYTPTWAVHVPGGRAAADAVALEHGFINLGEIIDNHFHFHHHAVSRRSLSPAPAHHNRLAADDRVSWAKQQRVLSRKKRDLIPFSTADPVWTAASPPLPSGGKREVSRKREMQSARQRARSADAKFQLNDPKWPHMWYLNRGGGLDMNVIPAWREGITGRGVVVTILDDGLETDHPDLVANYDSAASYDVNSHDSDPQPRYDMIDSNRHGTRCAGEVAATANNSLCAVGVAFGARVGGVRMLDGDVTDAVEARSLSLNPQHVDIYSASWGPDDDGKTVDGPGELATRAFIEGVTKGRNGKGSIFVWASGNGGREQDNCNCDGYTNSIWTLSISSATERGEVPWYSEMCSSTLAATYSSGSSNEKQIVTTDLHHTCTMGHTGTSASAPLAAGICALALQANRDLTWRDMQHIVVRTARPERLSASGHWHTNGVGRNVSHSFGYGLLDAAGMVRLARSWRTVPPQRRCELAAPRSQRNIPPRSTITLQLDVTSCPGVNFLEHVQARVSLAAARRGDLRITLTSPAGTTVVLLAPRAHDSSRAGFTSWPFMSVHMWGEAPLGLWQLQVYNEGRFMGRATLQDWSLILYGTSTPAAKNDPVPTQNPIIRNKGNATRPVMVQSGRKNKGKTVPIVPTYSVGLVKRKKNKNSKNPTKNKQGRPATKPPVEASTVRAVTSPAGPEAGPATRTDPGRSPDRGQVGLDTADSRGRKMSNLFEQYPKIQRIYPAPLQSNAGPLSQWELIFYGTETPPQPDFSQDTNGVDTPPWPSKEGAVDDVPGNALDEDFPMVWHDSHTIRDDGQALDHQQPTPSSNGCTTAAPQSPHNCLECARGLHLLEGRCYARCPDGTYASEMLTQRGSRRRNGTVFTEPVMKRHPLPTAFEAADMVPKTPLVCLPCHYSCAACSGADSYQCTACADDARLFNTTQPEGEVHHYCYPSSLLPQIDNAQWHYKMNIFLIIALFAATAISLYCILTWMLKNWCAEKHGRGSDSHTNLAYVKLAADEQKQDAIDVENEIHQAIADSTDDESEEDLKL